VSETEAVIRGITDAAEVGQIIERLRGSNGFRLFFERGRRILFTDLYF